MLFNIFPMPGVRLVPFHWENPSLFCMLSNLLELSRTEPQEHSRTHKEQPRDRKYR